VSAMGIFGHSVDKYVTGRMLATSNDRRWPHLLAERWSHAPGALPSLVPRDTEVVVMLRGSARVDREGGGVRQRTYGRPGTVWICPSGIREEFIDIANPIDECIHIFLPGRPFDDTMLRDLDIDPSRMSLRYESVAHDPFIEQVAERIRAELASETSTGRLLVEALGTALSAHLAHQYSATDARPKRRASAEKPLSGPRLSRVMEYIEAHVRRDFTIADLASAACMSPTHFAKSFKAATGRTPHEFVSDRRLGLAKRMLAAEDGQIADIAAATGFSSQANFTRAFHKVAGTTPGRYRSQLLGREGSASN
jgi:AraC family transcriptional regulator